MAVFLVIAVVVFLSSQNPLQQITDGWSELVTIQDAVKMIQGQHRWGVCDDTHYPKGPAYFILPFLPFVTNLPDLRIPVRLMAAVSVSAMFTFLLFRARRAVPILIALLSLVVLCSQPGMTRWWGDLHEHSHQMYMVFLVVWFGLWLPRVWTTFSILGFICGWIGYDFVPVQMGTMFIVRYIMHSRSNGCMLSIWRAFLEALSGVAGVAFAIVLHFAQNVLHFGSLDVAWKDFAGSAEARCSLGQLGNLDPQYVQTLKDANNGRPFPGRLHCAWAHWQAFNENFAWPFLLNGELFVALVLCLGTVLFVRSGWLKFLRDFAIVVFCSALASSAWMLIMPYHAWFHFHIMPRLFFAGYLNLFVFLIVASSRLPVNRGESR
jgi:hypothetical protein